VFNSEGAKLRWNKEGAGNMTQRK